MKKPDISAFQKAVWKHYKASGRHDLPWRKTDDPYKILVSEVMLQQTQVDRVIPKYSAFLKKFPTVRALAKASLGEVLALWSGLGYNRRALFLKRAAETVVADHKGKFPQEADDLEKLPGIGPYTARAVATFAYNAPYTFIETNIRRVFIHVFFPKGNEVPDAKLFPLIEASIDRKRSREWYWALMDYGAHLKGVVVNPNRRSKQYAKQSAFEGSLRQVRGAILREATRGPVTQATLLRSYEEADRKRVLAALSSLVAEGFLSVDEKGTIRIP